MPWVTSVPGIVHAWYLGNASGDAIADVFFGKQNLSGKLSLTFPKSEEGTLFIWPFPLRKRRGMLVFM